MNETTNLSTPSPLEHLRNAFYSYYGIFNKAADCDTDFDCLGDLMCFQRDTEPVPGCVGTPLDSEDYCIERPSPTTLIYKYDNNKPQSFHNYPLDECMVRSGLVILMVPVFIVVLWCHIIVLLFILIIVVVIVVCLNLHFA